MKRLLLAWLIIIPTVIYAANMPRISANPKVKEYNAQACKQLTAGNMDGALVSINKAIRLDSMDVISYHNKVTILMGLKAYKKALMTAKKGIQVDPDYVELLVLAGGLCELLADSASAFDYYKKAIVGFEKRISKPAYARQKSESQFNRACLLLYCGREAEGNQALKNLKAEGYSHPEDEFSGLLLVDRQAYLKKLGIKVSATTPL